MIDLPTITIRHPKLKVDPDRIDFRLIAPAADPAMIAKQLASRWQLKGYEVTHWQVDEWGNPRGRGLKVLLHRTER